MKEGLSKNMKPLKIVIIGASFAGLSSALTAKNLHPHVSVTVIDRQRCAFSDRKYQACK